MIVAELVKMVREVELGYSSGKTFILIYVKTLVFSYLISNKESKKNTLVGIIYRPNTEPRADFYIFTSTLFDIIDTLLIRKRSNA